MKPLRFASHEKDGGAGMAGATKLDVIGDPAK
jgi:hypothetical protein